MTDKFGDTFIIHYKTIDDNNEQTTQDEPETINLNENQQQNPPQQQQNQAPTQQQSFVSDEAQKEMIKSFLNGAQCLNGVCLFFYILNKKILIYKTCFKIRELDGGNMKFALVNM